MADAFPTPVPVLCTISAIFPTALAEPQSITRAISTQTDLQAPNSNYEQKADSQSTIALEYVRVIAQVMKAVKSPATLMRNANQVHDRDEICVFGQDLSARTLVHTLTRRQLRWESSCRRHANSWAA